jgi:hypothetical protein
MRGCLHVPIVMFYAALTKFVEALSDSVGVVIDSGTYLAEQSRVLELVKKFRGDHCIIGLF